MIDDDEEKLELFSEDVSEIFKYYKMRKNYLEYVLDTISPFDRPSIEARISELKRFAGIVEFIENGNKVSLRNAES